ncbi:MAG: hypothetical protein ACFB12_08975 [Leptolyngbyaceae cyanobacterium]
MAPMLGQVLERSRWPTDDHGIVSLQPWPRNASGRCSNLSGAGL